MRSNIQQLQAAADFRVVRNTLRHFGFRALILGGMALGVAGWETTPVPAAFALALIAFALIWTGVLNLTTRSFVGIAADGFALVALGAWLMANSIHAAILTGGQLGYAIVGIVVIILGLHSLAQYARFSKTPLEAPSPELEQTVDDIVKQARSASRRGRDMLTLTTKNVGTSVFWNVRLGDELVVLVAKDGREVLFAERSGFRVTRVDDERTPDLVRIEIDSSYLDETSRGEPIVGGMPLDAFQTYLGWRWGADAAARNQSLVA